MLAMVTPAFQERFGLEWIKLTPLSSYCIDDYGASHHYRGRGVGERDYKQRIIARIEDWGRIEPTDVNKGTYGRILRTLHKILKRRDPATPVVMTVFTASRMAGYMVGDDQLSVHMRKDPAPMKRAFSALAQTCESFVREVMAQGVDGILLSTSADSSNVMGLAEHDDFSRPFDRRFSRRPGTGG